MEQALPTPICASYVWCVVYVCHTCSVRCVRVRKQNHINSLTPISPASRFAALLPMTPSLISLFWGAPIFAPFLAILSLPKKARAQGNVSWWKNAQNIFSKTPPFRVEFLPLFWIDCVRHRSGMQGKLKSSLDTCSMKGREGRAAKVPPYTELLISSLPSWPSEMPEAATEKRLAPSLMLDRYMETRRAEETLAFRASS